MANEFVARNGVIALNNSQITGSLSVSNGITGSLFGTSSQSISSSYAYTASSATNAFNAITASYALSGGSTGAPTFPYTGSAIISGSLNITGSLNAPNITGSLFGTSSQAISASYAYTASSAISSSFSITSSITYSGTGSFTGSFIGIHTGSLFGTASQAITASLALTASYLLGSITSASYAYTASSATNAFNAVTASYALAGGSGANPFPYTGNAVITGSLTVYTGSLVLLSSQSGILFNQTLSQSLTPASSSVIYGVNITPTFVNSTGSQTQTALRVQATFTGSFTGSATTNRIVDFGATSVGSQFTVTDQTSGSIYMVNDVSGLPIIEAKSDWTVNIWNYPNIILQKTGSLINISGSLIVTGSTITTNGATFNGIFTGSYADGTVVDYNPSLGQGRFFVGALDNIGFYNGYGATTSSLMFMSASGLISASLFSGSFIGIYTGSLFGTASQAVSASYSYTASSAISSSYSITSSFSNGFRVSGSTSLSGSLGVSGSLYIQSKIPTIITGSGAGPTAPISITGSSNAGIFNFRTGATPVASSIIATVTYPTTFPIGSSIILYPANSGSSLLNTGSIPYATGSTTGFTVFSSTTALIASASYAWNYIVMGF